MGKRKKKERGQEQEVKQEKEQRKDEIDSSDDGRSISAGSTSKSIARDDQEPNCSNEELERFEEICHTVAEGDYC